MDQGPRHGRFVKSLDSSKSCNPWAASNPAVQPSQPNINFKEFNVYGSFTPSISGVNDMQNPTGNSFLRNFENLRNPTVNKPSSQVTSTEWHANPFRMDHAERNFQMQSSSSSNIACPAFSSSKTINEENCTKPFVKDYFHSRNEMQKMESSLGKSSHSSYDESQFDKLFENAWNDIRQQGKSEERSRIQKQANYVRDDFNCDESNNSAYNYRDSLPFNERSVEIERNDSYKSDMNFTENDEDVNKFSDEMYDIQPHRFVSHSKANISGKVDHGYKSFDPPPIKDKYCHKIDESARENYQSQQNSRDYNSKYNYGSHCAHDYTRDEMCTLPSQNMLQQNRFQNHRQDQMMQQNLARESLQQHPWSNKTKTNFQNVQDRVHGNVNETYRSNIHHRIKPTPRKSDYSNRSVNYHRISRKSRYSPKRNRSSSRDRERYQPENIRRAYNEIRSESNKRSTISNNANKISSKMRKLDKESLDRNRSPSLEILESASNKDEKYDSNHYDQDSEDVQPNYEDLLDNKGNSQYAQISPKSIFCRPCNFIGLGTPMEFRKHIHSMKHLKLTLLDVEKYALMEKYTSSLIELTKMRHEYKSGKSLKINSVVKEIQSQLLANGLKCCSKEMVNRRDSILHTTSLKHLLDQYNLKKRFNEKRQNQIRDDFLVMADFPDCSSNNTEKKYFFKFLLNQKRNHQLMHNLVSMCPSHLLQPGMDDITAYDPLLPQGLGWTSLHVRLYCQCCDLFFISANQYLQHASTKQHYYLLKAFYLEKNAQREGRIGEGKQSDIRKVKGNLTVQDVQQVNRSGVLQDPLRSVTGGEAQRKDTKRREACNKNIESDEELLYEDFPILEYDEENEKIKCTDVYNYGENQGIEDISCNDKNDETEEHQDITDEYQGIEDMRCDDKNDETEEHQDITDENQGIEDMRCDDKNDETEEHQGVTKEFDHFLTENDVTNDEKSLKNNGVEMYLDEQSEIFERSITSQEDNSDLQKEIEEQGTQEVEIEEAHNENVAEESEEKLDTRKMIKGRRIEDDHVVGSTVKEYIRSSHFEEKEKDDSEEITSLLYETKDEDNNEKKRIGGKMTENKVMEDLLVYQILTGDLEVERSESDAVTKVSASQSEDQSIIINTTTTTTSPKQSSRSIRKHKQLSKTEQSVDASEDEIKEEQREEMKIDEEKFLDKSPKSVKSVKGSTRKGKKAIESFVNEDTASHALRRSHRSKVAKNLY